MKRCKYHHDRLTWKTIITKFCICMLIVISSIIESNPKILGGKSVVKGTRVPVDLIYELVGLGLLNSSSELGQCWT
jgi:hypothetical protein